MTRPRARISDSPGRRWAGGRKRGAGHAAGGTTAWTLRNSSGSVEGLGSLEVGLRRGGAVEIVEAPVLAQEAGGVRRRLELVQWGQYVLLSVGLPHLAP